ncbi:MAG TPA: hypothetical protein PKI46_02760, partial [Bacteroidales bacterium]|nr:hypothetical protein [Bacteroidales bacterium]
RNGDVFAELKCEVNSEIVFITIWPEQYEKFKDIINSSLNKIVLINGSVDYNRYKQQNVIMTNSNTIIKTFEI